MPVQALGLTHRDMISQAAADTLNAEVRALLTEHDGQLSAEDAMEQVADQHGYTLVERDNETALIRNAAGEYAILWYESQFGQAMSVFTARDYEQDAVGFDNQALGWGETA